MNTMRALIGPIVPLLLGVMLLSFGGGLLGTLVGVDMAQGDVPPLVAGIIMAGYFAGLVAGAWVVQRFIGSVGHIRTYAAFAAILSAATLLHPLAFDETFWFVLRFAQGFAMSALLLCVESWLSERSDRSTRGQILALYMILFYAASATGQFLLSLPDESGFVRYVMASVLLSLAAVPVALARAPAPEFSAATPLGLVQLYRESPTGLMGCLASGLVMGAFYGLAAFHARDLGLTLTQVASFISVTILGGLVMQWPVGHLSDRHDRRKVIIATSGLLALVSVIMAFVPADGFSALLLFALLFGGAAATLYPLGVASANDRLRPGQSVAAGRSLLMAYGAGAVLGPLGAALFMQLLAGGLYVFTGVVAIGLAVFVVWRLRVADPVPESAQVAFHMLPRNTPESAEMDPRADGPVG